MNRSSTTGVDDAHDQLLNLHGDDADLEPSRRGFGKLAMGVIGLLAGLGTSGCVDVGCCLPLPGEARCPDAGSTYPYWNCPHGGVKRSWSCCMGNKGYTCGECIVQGDTGNCWGNQSTVFDCYWSGVTYVCC